jgi:hypothetical protein
MNSEIFQEKSGFPKAFAILLIFQAIVGSFILLKDHESPLIIIVITIPLTLLFLCSALKLNLDPQYFEYYFFPFMLKPKKIRWDEIKEIQLVHTDPISDFGGWGIRLSRKYGKAFITGGQEIIFLKLKNGKKRSFSIQNKEKLEAFLKENNILKC